MHFYNERGAKVKDFTLKKTDSEINDKIQY